MPSEEAVKNAELSRREKAKAQQEKTKKEHREYINAYKVLIASSGWALFKRDVDKRIHEGLNYFGESDNGHGEHSCQLQRLLGLQEAVKIPEDIAAEEL